MPTFEAWKESRIMTPLCILSRNILINIIFRTYNHNEIISDDKFIQILIEEIDKTKEFENENPESYKVDMPSSDQIPLLPFNFIVPDNKARREAFRYSRDKRKESIKFEEVGIVFKNQQGHNYNFNFNSSSV